MREMEGVHKQDMRKICIVIGGDYSWNALQKEFSAQENLRGREPPKWNPLLTVIFDIAVNVFGQ